MARLHYRCSPDQADICRGLNKLREQLDTPSEFSDEIMAEATASSEAGPQIPPGSAGTSVADRTSLELVTIDPPDSMDLDQAVHVEKTPQGWRVFYAIADVSAWVAPGSLIDKESRDRGSTMYSPDGRAPLHPMPISENAASLLPDQDRQSLLWTIDLDDAGHILDAELERAVVRSRAKLSYRDAAQHIEDGDHAGLLALREVGLRREQLEIERGAVSLRLASQEVVTTDTGFQLAYDESLPIEGWNAQISLLTGIAAADIMLKGGTGIVRTLPTPDDRTINELRHIARALGIDWPKSRSYADAVRALDPNEPQQAALIAQSARGLRGAGYEAFDGELPKHTSHSAIAADYAHVTAPLRRLGDRFANECVLAAIAGTRPPDWTLETLPELPKLLGNARNREGNLDRGVLDLVEAALLVDRVGETFVGLVTNIDEKRGRVRVQLREPAVVAYADGAANLGDEISVQLTEADIENRKVKFTLG